MSLQQEIIDWDEKSSADIGEIFEAHHNEPNFVDALLLAIADVHTQKGASWLLKAWLESGKALETRQTNHIFNLLNHLEQWESRLHLLQCLEYLPISGHNKKQLEKFLRDNLEHTNKFIRAWTYNGFHLLAINHPEYQEEVDRFFEMALRDEAASVKARIRNIKRL